VAFQKKVASESVLKQLDTFEKQKLPLSRLRNLLQNIQKWIQSMKPADIGKSIWSDYSKTQSYAPKEIEIKRRFIFRFIGSTTPKIVCDLGSNTGDYAKTALEAGAQYVIGFDNDYPSLELAFSRAKEENLSYLPLYLDAANPSPEQGWAQKERKGLNARLTPDATLALAFTHHLIIGRNIPFRELLVWLTGLAPHGVIEFVPKSDPMVQSMLRFRQDIFESYTDEQFLAYLGTVVNVTETEVVSSSGRRLIRYSRR
jgi:ribosomal protein L11 methylase PrmA